MTPESQTPAPTPALTNKGLATRQRIVEGAAAEFRHSGVTNTTLDDVISRTRTSKGQLFHYFPGGREELLIAVAQHEADQVLAEQQPHLSQLDSWPAWYAWRDVVIPRYRQQGDTCALSMLISQIGRSSPAARAVTTELLRQWQGELTVGIEGMQRTGEIDRALDPDWAAGALVAGIQGGVVVLLSTGRSDNLEAAIDLILDHLKDSGNGATEGRLGSNVHSEPPPTA